MKKRKSLAPAKPFFSWSDSNNAISFPLFFLRHNTGNYTCEVEWSDKPPVRLRHYLEVRVPPTVYPEGAGSDAGGGSAVVVREGRENATLSCKAEGIPTPTVEWVRNDSIGMLFPTFCSEERKCSTYYVI